MCHTVIDHYFCGHPELAVTYRNACICSPAEMKHSVRRLSFPCPDCVDHQLHEYSLDERHYEAVYRLYCYAVNASKEELLQTLITTHRDHLALSRTAVSDSPHRLRAVAVILLPEGHPYEALSFAVDVVDCVRATLSQSEYVAPAGIPGLATARANTLASQRFPLRTRLDLLAGPAALDGLPHAEYLQALIRPLLDLQTNTGPRAIYCVGNDTIDLCNRLARRQSRLPDLPRAIAYSTEPWEHTPFDWMPFNISAPATGQDNAPEASASVQADVERRGPQEPPRGHFNIDDDLTDHSMDNAESDVHFDPATRTYSVFMGELDYGTEDMDVRGWAVVGESVQGGHGGLDGGVVIQADQRNRTGPHHGNSGVAQHDGAHLHTRRGGAGGDYGHAARNDNGHPPSQHRASHNARVPRLDRERGRRRRLSQQIEEYYGENTSEEVDQDGTNDRDHQVNPFGLTIEDEEYLAGDEIDVERDYGGDFIRAFDDVLTIHRSPANTNALNRSHINAADGGGALSDGITNRPRHHRIRRIRDRAFGSLRRRFRGRTTRT